MSKICEIVAIVRPNKMLATKKALAEIGLPSFTAFACFGRGRQGGRIGELSYPVSPEIVEKAKELKPTFIPKRIILAVVPEAMVEKVVQTIIKVNQTGQHGDGKIFVLPVEESLRIRTGEKNLEALF
ncbi:nitrogen regulatory protein P-II [Thermodesulfatator indicus DSM 15286]|uniref:Nitrogen regulatory protein P-II n=1 Tax=Thermodesulfatator indicus (strain DSM 15286 / JCM 11887 / CIR29812) TaxID=667014 RepID=F8ADV7_THEID|nr:P-II family nitrogen regulator [Thermodesulfatator indicus]AEH44922.1 nitrogen regulatory protein P-II [Thermodesulfatator indicus DSM 15286]